MRIRNLFLLVIFLSACVGQAETATLENTVVSLTEIPTPTEAFTPFPWTTATPVLPEEDASAYQFKPLSEDEYKYFFDSIRYSPDEQRFDVYYIEIPQYLVALQSEYLLNFSNSSNKEEIEWSVAVQAANTEYSKTDIGKGLIEEYFLEMFSKGLTIEEIDEKLQSRNILLMDSLEANNLIGKGEKGIVLMVRLPDEFGSIATFFAYSNNGVFGVQKIIDWRASFLPAMGIYFYPSYIGDTNNNGIDEIIIQIENGHSGIPQTWGETLRHIEWSNDKNDFLSYEFPVYFQECDEFGTGPCKGEFEFSIVDSKQVLITRGELFTRYICPNLTFQRMSFWNGEKYEKGDLEVDMPDRKFTPECLLAWVESVSAVDTLDRTFHNDGIIGWKNSDVIYYAEQSLQNWSRTMDNMFGPASQDYVKLQLGLWYDQRGEHEKATFVLQEVANQPYSKRYGFISQMVSQYLQTRSALGNAQACIQINNAFINDFRSKISEPSSVFSLDKDYLQVWGVVDWKGDLCNEKEMLKSEIESEKINDEESLINFLNNSKIDIYHTETADFDDDGTTDLLVFFNINDSPVLWIFYSTSDGYIVQDTNIDVWGDDTYLKMMDFSNSTAQKIFLLSADDWVRIINILPSGEIRILLEEYGGVKSLGVSQSQDSIRMIVNIEDYWGEKRTSIYEWNALEKDFVLTPSVFEIAQKELEENLYVENNYLNVINIVEGFLPNAPPEPVDWYSCSANSGCTYSQPFYIPYFRYLQGLSYEQLGDFDKARDVYYQLWNDYPDNVFGVVASMKLELVK